MAEKTLESIINGSYKLTEDEKTKLKEAMGITGRDPTGGGSGARNAKEQQQYNEVLQRTSEILGNNAQAREYELKLLKQKLAGLLGGEDAMTRINALAAGRTEGLGDMVDIETKLTEEQRKQLKQLYTITEGMEDYGRKQKVVLGEIASGIGLTMRLEETFMGSVLEVTTALSAQGDAGNKARAAFKEQLKDIFKWENIALSVFTAIAEQTIKLISQLDEARAKLAGLTGAGEEFSGAMYAAQRQSNLMGVSMDDAATATGGLVAETANFAKLNKSSQTEVIRTTAMLEKLGVDTATAAATFDFFNNNLGMTAHEASNTQKQLAMLGNEIGISSQKILKDFQAALPTLAVYGRQSVDVFENLAAAAKAANVETGALLGIAKQFDTFAGAAEGAGKLNALLGTQLSTTQMLMMKEDERIETLINAVQAQGVAWGDMDKYTQLAIAHAAGIDDMNEAAKIFGMNTAEYQKNQKVMAKNAEVQEKFEKAVAKTVPVMQKFKLLATELIIAVEPILDWLGWVAEGLTEFVNGLDETTKAWVVGVPLFIAGGALLLKMFMGITGAMTAMATGGPLAAGGITAVGLAAEGVIASLSTLFAVPGIGQIAAIIAGGALVAIGIIGATVAITADAQARIAEAEAEQAKTRAGMLNTTAQLAESSGVLLENLVALSVTTFDTAIAGLNSLIEAANEFGNMNPKASATLENLALITVGKAKDSMTNQVIEGTKTTINASVNNVFKGMKMEIKLDNQNTLKGYVTKIAEGVVDQH